MATTARPLPLTTVDPSAENSSSFYDYDYHYLDGVAFLLCRKDEVLSFAKVFLPVFYSLVFVLGLCGNLLLLVVLLRCMSLDKYLEIVHAQPHHRLRSRARSLLLAAAVWAVALAISIPDMVFVQTHENPKGVWNCYADFGGHATVWKLFLRFLQNLLGFLLPLLTMIFFYSRIGCVLVRLRPPGQGRALRMAAALVVAFFALWFPYNLVLFLLSLMDLQVFGDCEVSQRMDYALQVTESIAFLHCCFTPILYTFFSRRFRQYLKALLAAVLRRRLAPDASRASLSSCSENSMLTAQEEMTGMNDLGASRRFRQYLKALLAAVLRRRLAPDASRASLSSCSENSMLTAQEEMTGMNDLGARWVEGPPNKGDVDKN
ncbi:Chemokine-binding protein 2 [Tupaia chinensis]|uniref:Chemokine-binding protein 2 n=1 Tax=Tupaia chinensis TaxID=246437 RepID=L9K6G4_TUPCH|nr:Chemokine-binding protein 2 [Tupaia chinensis]